MKQHEYKYRGQTLCKRACDPNAVGSDWTPCSESEQKAFERAAAKAKAKAK